MDKRPSSSGQSSKNAANAESPPEEERPSKKNLHGSLVPQSRAQQMQDHHDGEDMNSITGKMIKGAFEKVIADTVEELVKSVAEDLGVSPLGAIAKPAGQILGKAITDTIVSGLSPSSRSSKHGAPLQLRYAQKEPSELKSLRQQAYLKLGLDVNKVNICVTGKGGAGKSTLINGLRGLEPGAAGSAKVDVNECTDSLAAYPYLKDGKVVLWDLPGAESLKHPRSTYFIDNSLFAFDHMFIVFCDRFGEFETDLIKQASAHQVPYTLIRNKANLDYDAKRKTDKAYRAMTKSESVRLLIEEHRIKTVQHLNEADIKSEDVKLFIINAHALVFPDEVAFEESKLITHLSELSTRLRSGGPAVGSGQTNRGSPSASLL